MSADSRTTMTWTSPPDGDGRVTFTNVVLSDSARKLFLLFGRFGVGTFGDEFISNMPIAHYVADYEARAKGSEPKTTEACGRQLNEYFAKLLPRPNVGFFVSGFDDLMPFAFHANALTGDLARQNVAAGTSEIQYGVAYGGDTAVLGRLLGDPKFLPAFGVMPLQDAIDFSRHLVRTTIEQLRFEPRFATVGGAIDTVIVQPGEARWLSQKELTAK
jgi:hypothetical protein